MGNAIARRAEHQMSRTSDVRNYFSEGEVRDQFTATILHYTPRQLARMSGCSTDATRRWIDGSRCPNLASAINVARALPAVRDWIMEAIGVREAQAGSVDAVVQALYAIAAGNGEEAHKARQLIWRLHHEP